MLFDLRNNPQNIWFLVLKNIPDAIQEFPGDLHDGSRLAHPLTIFMKRHHERRVFTGRYPRGFDQRSPQGAMTSFRDPSRMLGLPLSCASGIKPT